MEEMEAASNLAWVNQEKSSCCVLATGVKLIMMP